LICKNEQHWLYYCAPSFIYSSTQYVSLTRNNNNNNCSAKLYVVLLPHLHGLHKSTGIRLTQSVLQSGPKSCKNISGKNLSWTQQFWW